ncbi:MAG: hypothetical protein ACOYL3_10455 [Desulfuromonadaceae bacterium]
MKPEVFIDRVLICDIGKVIKAECAYLAFGLIAQGIETLGAILDEQEIHDICLAEVRFRNAVATLFNGQGSLYPKYASADSEYDLFKYLRCGMAHVLRPAGKIGFTTRKQSIENGTKHMEVSKETGQLILVIEDFYSDFEKACIKCKNAIPKKSHAKLKNDYIICSQVASGGP